MPTMTVVGIGVVCGTIGVAAGCALKTYLEKRRTDQKWKDWVAKEIGAMRRLIEESFRDKIPIGFPPPQSK